MVITEEQKEKQREYNKMWREKNPDYFKEYYKEHRKKILESAKRWREENKGDYVYFYINKDGSNIYIGSTGGRPLVERTSFHLNSHSNLQMSAEDLVNDHYLTCILFKNFNEYKLSREDLYAIEKYYKDEQGSILNKQTIIIHEENLTRSIDELIEIAENTKYEEFKKLEKYLN